MPVADTSAAAEAPLCIYIAGYGRSGSTLLDAILSNHPRISGVGELSYLFEELKAQGRCSCQQPLASCGHWCGVLRLLDAHLQDGRSYEQLEALTRCAEAVRLRAVSARQLEAYGALWRGIFRALAEVSSERGGARAVVDSSKSTRRTWNRPLVLRRCGLRVKVIHLVRDPRAVMWSVGRGSNRRLEVGAAGGRPGAMVRGLLGWLLANLAAEYVKRQLPPGDTLLLHYEALVTDSAAQLSRVSEFLGLGALPALVPGAAFEAGHGVAGNRMRRGTLHLKNDDEWTRALPRAGHLFSLLAWPLARRYGYALTPVSAARWG